MRGLSGRPLALLALELGIAEMENVHIVLVAPVGISQRFPGDVDAEGLLLGLGLHIIGGIVVLVGMQEANLDAPGTPDRFELGSRLDTEDVVVG